MYLVFVIYHIMNVKKMRVCIYTEYNFLKITIRSRDNSLWGCLWNNIVWHYRLYRCSLKQHIGLFSRDIPKFDPYSLVSGVRNHVLKGQHPSGGSLWNKTVVLFTKILTIDFDLKRKRTILFLFTKILTRILACKICRISTIVVTLS